MPRRVCAIFVVLCCASLLVALAEDKDQKKKQRKRPEGPRVVGQRPQATTPKAPMRRAADIRRDTGEEPPPPAGKPITMDELTKLLNELGYKTKRQMEDEHEWVDVSMKQDDWTFNLMIDLSPDKSNIWLSIDLASFAPEAVDSSDTLAILEANDSIWPAYFTYYTDENVLWMYQPLQNAGVTSDSLKSAVEFFTGNIKDTVDLWDL